MLRLRGGMVLGKFFYLKFFFCLVIYVFFFFKGLYGAVVFSFLFDRVRVILKLMRVVVFYLILEYNSLFRINLSRIYVFLNFLLWVFSLMVFRTRRFFYFFVFFEFSIVPMFLIIISWGSQPERLRASLYFFVYTIIGGVPLLVAILRLKYLVESFNFFLLRFNSMGGGRGLLLFFLSLYWVLAFMIKMPIYGLHFWLPMAHVEAPVGGSMSLAGVLIKMGSYGLYRLRFIGFSYHFIEVGSFYWVLGGKLILGVFIFRCIDLKRVVAYSSIIHMSLTLLVLFRFSYTSFLGFLLLLISHALIRRGLFYFIGHLYCLTRRRRVMAKRGYNFFNLSVLYLFFFLIFNMSFPPFSSFLSELFLVRSVLIFHYFSFFFLFISFILVGFFKMYMFRVISHGKGYTVRRFGLISTGIFYLGCLLHIFFFILIFFLISFYF